jgi:hypothetical protein
LFWDHRLTAAVDALLHEKSNVAVKSFTSSVANRDALGKLQILKEKGVISRSLHLSRPSVQISDESISTELKAEFELIIKVTEARLASALFEAKQKEYETNRLVWANHSTSFTTALGSIKARFIPSPPLLPRSHHWSPA